MEEKNQLLTVCRACDALQDVSHITKGNIASCICCGVRLFKHSKSPIEFPLAILLACAIFFVIANIYPVMQLNIAGIDRETTLIETTHILFIEGSPILATIVGLSSVVFPGFCVFSLLYIFLSIYFNKKWHLTRALLIWVSRLLPWVMMDVYLLAILVAIVKLVSLANVVLGIGFSALVGFVIFYAIAMSSIEMHMLWARLDKSNNGEQYE
ncbi:MAG: paraquat-inducible protein A [Gammaproteobacteria bacterium]|nr:paraquat-inducible protein A [Gammaproteobacteria bacterium]